MRNLKRALSLVLAMVMLLGMVMVPASAESTNTVSTIKFADADEIKYTDAVAITGGVGLFAGTDGKFLPKGTVTRAQMATIIVKMLHGADANADSFKGSGKFSDTASFEGGWAEGYINWCATLGVVAGYGDGTFRPGQAVTTAEAATMILNALKIDAGPGTWPTTVMAKATEEKIFEDLKPMPDTNTALTREELAVMSLNGMNYSPSGANVYRVGDKTFDNAADAHFYIQANGGTMEVLLPEDSLAGKVYGLLKEDGWIVSNQACGLDYTEIRLANGDSLWLDLVTDENDLGHKVEVWYKEVYTDEEERGTAYTLIDQFEYITLAEDAVNEKEYRAAFGRKYDLNLLAAADGSYNVEFDAAAAAILDARATDYVANVSAPAGTYAIDPDTNTVCAYYAPVQYTAAKVGFVSTAAGQETITIDSQILDNSEDGDEVIEYSGIAKDDFVVYYAVQDMYVIAKMETVTGSITAHSVVDGKVVVEIDGKEYTESTAAGTIAATMTADDIDDVDFDQVYTFYLAPDGTFVCFVIAEESSLNLSGTLYLMGIIEKTEKDSYGKETTNFFARGIDMTGNEALVLIGAKPEGGDLVGADTMTGNANDFYTVKELTNSKEARELGLFELIPVPAAYDETQPNAPFTMAITYGKTGAKWEVGGEFEFGVADKFTGNTSVAAPGSSYSYAHKNTKFVVVAGTATQGYPLETAVYNMPLTLYFALASQGRALLTRNTGGTDNIEAVVFPVNNLDATTNATIIYAPKQSVVRSGRIEWSDLTPAGTTANGNTYKVFNAMTGEAMDITLDDSIEVLPCGFYSVGYDSANELYKLAINPETGLPYKVFSDETNYNTGSTELARRNYAVDGRDYENVMYDRKVTAISGSNFWVENYKSNLSSSGAKVIDVRSDAVIAASGIGKITAIDQIYSIKESMPWVDFEVDFCYDVATSKIAGFFVEVFNNAEYGLGDTVIVATAGSRTAIALSGEMQKFGDKITLPAGTVVETSGIYNLAAAGNGTVELTPYAGVEATYYIDGVTDASLPAFEQAIDATGNDLIDEAAYADYTADGAAVINYAVCEIGGKDTLVTFAAGDKIGSYNTVNDPVSASDFDIFFDATESAVDEDTIAGWLTSVLGYNLYELDGNDLLVVTDEAAGTVIEGTDIAVLDTLQGMTINNESRQDIDELNDLKYLITNGYEVKGKYYDLGSTSLLNIDYCEKVAVAAGATLELADFTGSTNGVVRLDQNATVSAGISIAAGSDYMLDLNGKTLTVSENATIFTVSGKFTVIDSVGGGKIDYNGNQNYLVLVTGGTFVLESGELTNFQRAGNGGLIALTTANGTFTMNGGKLTDSSATAQTLIRTSNSPTNCTITINGGEISGGTATALGGAIYIYDGVTMTINGGVIKNNVGVGGGAIYICAGGKVIMTGGEISGNKADNGGAVYICDGGKFTMEGGTIKDNQATTGNGGAVYVQKGGTFNMDGGTITGNKVVATNKWGGAIYLEAGASTKHTVFTMTDGTITKNYTPHRGGGISTEEKAANNFIDITISGGKIIGNAAGGRAGNIHTFGANVNISGGTFGTAYTDAAFTTVGTASDKDVEFRGYTTAVISGGTFDTVGTQGHDSAWNVTVKGSAKIKSLCLVGQNGFTNNQGVTDTNPDNDSKAAIGELTTGEVKLGNAVQAGVTLEYDPAKVKCEGTHGKTGAVYTKK